MKNAVIVMIGCLICFGGGLYLGVSKVDEQADKWDVRYKEIDDKVSTFVDVSNPKTIRLYTNELRSILDNMSRLSKIIDKGEEIDIALGQILDGTLDVRDDTS